MKIKIYISTLIAFCLSITLHAQNKELFERETFISDGDTLLYRILYPENFDHDKAYPLVLFLHGAGERGNDNKKQLVHGSSLFLQEENREKYPAVVVFPQCPKEDYWSNVSVTRNEAGKRSFDFSPEGPPTKAMQLVLSMMDSLKQLATTDHSRIYVAGLSMGGMGTFEIVKRRPKLFAAAMPICGGGNPEDASLYADQVAFWIFHGAKDDIVDPAHSEKMYQALRAEGANVKFSLYPEANHNSWDPAFAEPEFMSWLFSKSK